MKKIYLTCFLLLLSAAWVSAQSSQTGTSSGTQAAGETAGNAQSGSASAQNSASPHNHGSQTQLEGCLSGSAGNYTLTANNGTTYQLQGTDKQLSKHVGQEVKVKGTANAGAASSGSANTPGMNTGASTQESFQVSKVKKVSKSCTTGNTSNPSSR